MKEDKITISVNEEDVQNLINCYEKDIEYIKQLETNWKELKKYVNNQLDNLQFEYEERFLERKEFNNKLGVLNRLKSKMQEIESGKED